MAKATGLGSVFVRARDPKRLTAWYVEHLGLPAREWGGVMFVWGAVRFAGGLRMHGVVVVSRGYGLLRWRGTAGDAELSRG
jgi:hypothetical protein